MPVLVIGRVVLNPEDRTRVVIASNLLQKVQVGLCVEYGIASIKELRRTQLYATEDFHASTLPGCRKLRLVSFAGPSPMEGGVLPKGCFVGMNQGCPLGSGVFLDWDKYTGANDPVAGRPPAPMFASVVARKSPVDATACVHVPDGR